MWAYVCGWYDSGVSGNVLLSSRTDQRSQIYSAHSWDSGLLQYLPTTWTLWAVIHTLKHIHICRGTHTQDRNYGMSELCTYCSARNQVFWHSYIKKLLSVYSVAWINHVLVCIFAKMFFIYFFINFFYLIDYASTFSYEIRKTNVSN